MVCFTQALPHSTVQPPIEKSYTFCGLLAAWYGWGNAGRGIAEGSSSSHISSITCERRTAAWGFPAPQPRPAGGTWLGMAANDPERMG